MILDADPNCSILLGHKYYEATHSDCAGLVILLSNIFSMLGFTGSRIPGPARYEAECTGALSGFRTLMQWVAMLMRPTSSSYTAWNSESISIVGSR